MNYSQYTDEQLVELSVNDKYAMDYLIAKYKGVVLSSIKSLYILGGDNDDLVQEGMIGLFKAVRDFDVSKNIKFSTFANLCVKRNVYSAITKQNNPKYESLNKAISISSTDYQENEDNEISTLSTEDLGLSDIYNPENKLISKENYDDLMKFMEENLSSLEYKVMDLYVIGLSTSEIAKVLEKNEKTTDNALQRAKNKIKKYVEEY